MRFIDHCPNCFSSTSSDEGNSDGDKRKKRRKTLFNPLERYVSALVLSGGNRKVADRDFYSKFYDSAAVQPKYFCAGKKYEIERKHKVKKRELLNDKAGGNGRNYTTAIYRYHDNIKGESH